MAVYDELATCQAKDELLRAGLHAGSDADDLVPEAIVRSWRRCIAGSVPQAGFAAPFLGTADPDSPLLRAARPVLDRIGDNFTDAEVALFMADHTGQIVLRRGGGGSGSRGVVGSDFSESTIGTNALGTVLEERRPVFVRGAEHFNEDLVGMACAGVPVHRPWSNEIVGSFAIAGRAETAHHLMTHLARDVGHQIENILAMQRGSRERALVQAYLTANQNSREPVIVVSRHTALANRAGLAHLSSEFHALVMEQLAGRHESGSATLATLRLPEGEREALVQRVAGAGPDSTYLLRLSPTQPSLAARNNGSSSAKPGSRRTLRAADPLLVARERAEAVLATGECLLVNGAAGAGKRHLVDRLLADRPPERACLVVDLALQPSRSEQWTREAIETVESGGDLVLLHLQSLPRGRTDLVSALAAETKARSQAAGPEPPWMLCTVDLTASPDHVLALAGRAATAVEMPRLSLMPERIPGLVEEMVTDLPTEVRPARFDSEAWRLMMRWGWPGNLAELRHVVAEMGALRPGLQVRARDLPRRIKATSSTRPLSPLESVERSTIVDALTRAGGNHSRAAKSLGISRSTLYRKIRSYQIPH